MAGHFISQAGMRRSRHYEGITRAIVKRENPGKKMVIDHSNCGPFYPYIDALAGVKQNFNEKTWKREDAEEVSKEDAIRTLNRKKKRANNSHPKKKSNHPFARMNDGGPKRKRKAT